MKISQKSHKYPLGLFGGSDQKKIFQKIIAHQEATFLGQFFFSKTNILGFQKILDPLDPKIRKISEIWGFASKIFKPPS